ncbi:MAG TPA: hypothetical protein DET40_14570 [Lentisphaeria bacterium]|nr:MAG: hypothetical protein A2X45_05740 [Lentisphaerae bacterium GWF2_50_93]HCE44762.1 hypothetical protein [Lentisphaeria bacterium]
MEDLNYFNLIESFNVSGCPLCSILKERLEKFLYNFLDETVTDVDSRLRIRKTFGFCSVHAWMLQKSENCMGQGIIYQDLIETFHANFIFPSDPKKTRKALDNLIAARKCLICNHVGEIEKRYLEVFSGSYDNMELRAAYEKSQGLCLNHMALAVRSWKNSRTIPAYLEAESMKLKGLDAELKEFVRKFDYRYSGEKFGGEKDSWIRAIEKISGRKGSHY